VKVAVLSRNRLLHSTQRLLEAGRRRGHTVEVIDYLRCSMNITAASPKILYQGEPIVDVDAVIPRIGATFAGYGTAVVRQFQILGVFSANDCEAIARAHDKLGALQLLAHQGIGLPATGFAHSNQDLDELIDSVGGSPLVVKLLAPSTRIGAILAETDQAAQSVIEAFQDLDANSLVQQYVKEAAGCSLRCLVVGSRVRASMLRKAPPGEFRSNLHRGGKAEKVKLSPEERRTAVRAAAAMGLEIAGVDMLRSKAGPLVMGVNSTPELEAIERASGVDVAGKIFEFIEKSVARRSRGEVAAV